MSTSTANRAAAPKHTLRNTVIFGAFFATVITSGLEAAGILPSWNIVELLLVTGTGYAVLASIALIIRTLITGKSIHQ